MKILDDMKKVIINCREKSVPFVGICTVDPTDTVINIHNWLNPKAPTLTWDMAAGFAGANKATKELIEARKLAGFETKIYDPTAAFAEILKLPERSIVFFMNAQEYLGVPTVSQALWNCRDKFTATGNQVFLLGPSFAHAIPSQLQQDIIVVREPLPQAEDLRKAVVDMIKDIDPPLTITDAQMSHIINAGRGLGRFAFDQVLALALTETSINLDLFWQLKEEQIKQIPGLSFDKSTLCFDDLGGLDHIKDTWSKIFAGKNAPELIIFIDEIEKQLVTTDSSGVGKDQLGVLLKEMENNRWGGMILVGSSGSGKTAVATSIANTYGIKTIDLDLGGAKGGIVGQSEHQIRAAVDSIKAMGGGRVRFVATCNNYESLTPEFLRRFNDGIYFFDIADKAMKEKVWAKNLQRFNIAEQELPDDTDWAAANIRDCCRMADEYSCLLKEVASKVVPVGRSSSKQIEYSRGQAQGVFLDANLFGTYYRERHEDPEDEKDETAIRKGRKIQKSTVN